MVRLVDVNCTPNQSLDRMIYSLTTTANEIDDNTMKNYLKYGENFTWRGWGCDMYRANAL